MSLIDAFADPATPAFRQERPAVVRARMAWARQRLATARARPIERLLNRVSIGLEVMVEYRPGAWARARVMSIEPPTLAVTDPGQLLAKVRVIDPPADCRADIQLHRMCTLRAVEA